MGLYENAVRDLTNGVQSKLAPTNPDGSQQAINLIAFAPLVLQLASACLGRGRAVDSLVEATKSPSKRERRLVKRKLIREHGRRAFYEGGGDELVEAILQTAKEARPADLNSLFHELKEEEEILNYEN